MNIWSQYRRHKDRERFISLGVSGVKFPEEKGLNQLIKDNKECPGGKFRWEVS